MSAPSVDELRADGRLVVDAPKRKLAVYANPYGAIVVFERDGAEERHIVIEAEEIEGLCDAIVRATRDALVTVTIRSTEYEAHRVIERAKGPAA